jgi:triosephosphate isomerase
MPEKRKPIISGNWKMHHDHLEAIRVIQKLNFRLDTEVYKKVDVSVHPPFTDLRALQTLIDVDNMSILLGAQHCHWEDKGAFTGEVSPAFLAKLNVQLVICGHSERRELFGETDEMVNRKVKAVLGHEMTPIMCVGETLEEREAGETAAKVSRQVQGGLAGVDPAAVAAMVIAYEPIWAIGTGKTASTAQAQEMHAFIRSVLVKKYGAAVGEDISILYGGSVKAANAKELFSAPDVDGGLVGGASLSAPEFIEIIRALKQ